MLGKNWPPGANHQNAQETDVQGHGNGRMYKAMFRVKHQRHPF
jgi:hypothetical protein